MVELVYLIPDAVAQAEQKHGRRVLYAVVHAHAVFAIGSRHRRNDALGGERLVDNTLGKHPQPLDVSLIEHARIHALVSGFDARVQREVVVHGEVKAQGVLLLVLLHPLLVKPVLRGARVTVEPVFRARYRAAGTCLLHEGAWHKRHLVEHHARKRHTLDEHVRRLVTSAEQVVRVLPPVFRRDDEAVLVALLNQREVSGEPVTQGENHVTPQGLDGLSAYREGLMVEAGHAPEYEADRHGDGLAGADGAVGYDSVAVFVPRLLPPEHRHELSARKLAINHRPRPPAPRRGRFATSESYRAGCCPRDAQRLRRTWNRSRICSSTAEPGGC